MTYNKRHKKHLGQHFLTDPWLLNDLINAIAPKPTDQVIEIGPGSGQLTRPISALVKRMMLFEVDRDCVGYLRELAWDCTVDIVHQDILLSDWSFLSAWAKNGPVRVIGNLPYNIASQIMINMIPYSELLTDMYFMVQTEVALRCLSPKNQKSYGRLSVMLQTYFEVESVMDVPPEAFDPPPKVESMVIRLSPKFLDYKLPPDYPILVERAFSSRRKTLRKALSGIVGSSFWSSLPDDMAQARAEQLTLDQFKQLAVNYSSYKLKQNQE